MQRLTLVFVLCTLISLALSASPPSFCKCTCFTNSTIIQLGPQHSDPSSEAAANLFARAAGGSSSCSQCNRAFCLAQRIPICRNAEEKDVFTTCFQRDSRKDQIIVLLFIAATVGLLAWTAVKQIMEKRSSMGLGGLGRQSAQGQGQGQYEALDGR